MKVYLHLAQMKHINVVLQCRKGKGRKMRFMAPLPAVKVKESEGPIAAGAARELCSGVPLVPLSNLPFSSCICLKMKTRPDFHVPFQRIGVGLKELYVFRYWHAPGQRQQGGTRVAMMGDVPIKPHKMTSFLKPNEEVDWKNHL